MSNDYTYSQILDAVAGFQMLSRVCIQQGDTERAFKVARVLSQLKAEAGVFQIVKTDIAAKHGIEDPQTKDYRVPENSPAMVKFQKEVQAALHKTPDVPLDIEPVAVSVDLLQSLDKLAPDAFNLIWPMIVMEEVKA